MATNSGNASAINRAFDRLLAKERAAGLAAISKGAKVGEEYALAIHDTAKHELHLILGGDFGYGVGEDRVVKDKDVVVGKVQVRRTAERKIDEHIKGGPRKGVIGVVSAGMDAGVFDDSWEVSVLKSAYRHAVSVAMDEFEKKMR